MEKKCLSSFKLKGFNTFIFLMIFFMGIASAQQNFVFEDHKIAQKRFEEFLKIKQVEIDGNLVTQKQMRDFVREAIDYDESQGISDRYIRWSNTIRYYVEGLEGFPQMQQELDSVVNEISKITRKKFIKHEQIYWPQKGGSRLHPKAPGGRYTNVVLIFTRDIEEVFTSEDFKTFHRLAKYDTEKILANWRNSNKAIKNPSEVGGMLTRISGRSRMTYYHAINDDIDFFENIIKKQNIKKKKSYFRRIFFELMSSNPNSPKSNILMPSFANFGDKKVDLASFNELDTEFLKAYNTRIPPGIPKEFAIEVIFRNVWVSLTNKKSLKKIDTK